MKHTSTQKLNRVQNVIAGAGTVLDVFPRQMPSVRRTAFRHVLFSDADALRNDWQSIGNDFAPALRMIADELVDSLNHVGPFGR